MVGVIWIGAISITAFTAALASIVFYVYLRSLRFGRSRLSLGLVLFAAFIVMQSVVALYSYFQLAGSFGPEVGFPAMVISLTELLAISFLLWATWQ